MRLLFILHGRTYLKNYQQVMELLGQSDHEIVWAIHTEEEEGPKTSGFMRAALKKYDNIRLVSLPEPVIEDSAYHKRLASAHDFTKYLSDELIKADFIRDRARSALENGADKIFEGEYAKNEWKLISRALYLKNWKIKTPPNTIEFLESIKPDAIFALPYVFKSVYYQSQYAKAAKLLRIPFGVPVYSWDNLSNKGSFKVRPDRIFVWNDIQAKEAIDWHLVDSETVCIVGGSRFDFFYNHKPEITKEELCKQFKLNPGKPVITYLASSETIAPNEELFVRKWIKTIRSSSDAVLNQANIIIRPYPHIGKDWEFSDFENVAVNNEKDVVRGVLDSIGHTDIVVGINTTAMLEAAAQGKPIFTLETEETRHGQYNSFHYGYLKGEFGGLLHITKSMEDHATQLIECLDNNRRFVQKSESFTQSFLRPRGINKKVAPILVEEMIRFAKEQKTIKPVMIKDVLASLYLKIRYGLTI